MLEDKGRLLLIQMFPFDGVRNVGAVTGGVNGFVEIGLGLHPMFPLAKAVFNLYRVK